MAKPEQKPRNRNRAKKAAIKKHFSDKSSSYELLAKSLNFRPEDHKVVAKAAESAKDENANSYKKEVGMLLHKANNGILHQLMRSSDSDEALAAKFQLEEIEAARNAFKLG